MGDSYPGGPQPWFVADGKCSGEPSADTKGLWGNQPASLPPGSLTPQLGPWEAGWWQVSLYNCFLLDPVCIGCIQGSQSQI